ncbi:hypothetical protein [Yoonia sediminilitoris]|uniref:PilZ domain-containing protein n=2 Tax=Yoonia sediminilitoris TaxID=1286148 RepID=A0A2T6KDP3_9RHOB|nr:hypothetical protein [Yoonia sediminilitoris]PUB13140.1 hypothetical protein C8N45_10860 [Yoonia sediminilitoris]RCW94475.1 hypothetical protein DFP92_10861 [Yoonia sediminilitoris]
MQIAAAKDTPSLPQYVRLLRKRLDLLADRTVIDAIGGPDRLQLQEVFRRFLYNSRFALQTFNGDDPVAAYEYYRTPEVRDNLLLVGFYLPSLLCDETEVAQPTSPSPGDFRRAGSSDTAFKSALEEVIGDEMGATEKKTLQDRVSAPSSLQINLDSEATTSILDGVLKLGIGILAAGAAYIAFWASRWLLAGRRHRARRYPAQYKTVSKIDGETIEGVLHDISSRGTKFAHSLDRSIAIKTPVAVQIFDEWYEGSVAWSNDHYAGVIFRSGPKPKVVRAVHSHISKRIDDFT